MPLHSDILEKQVQSLQGEFLARHKNLDGGRQALDFIGKLTTRFGNDQSILLANQSSRVINYIIKQAFEVQQKKLNEQQALDDAYAYIQSIFKQETAKTQQKTAERAANFNADDKKPLAKHPNKTNTLLTDDHLRGLMPESNEQQNFTVLAPMAMDALRVHEEVITQMLTKEKFSIAIPVSDGTAHWRLLHIYKNSKNENIEVTLFDSLGAENAKELVKTIAARLPASLGKVTCYPSKKMQRDSFSCGDFVVAETHRLAAEQGLVHNQNFVDALEKGQRLRPLMIAASAKHSAPASPVVTAAPATSVSKPVATTPIGNNNNASSSSTYSTMLTFADASKQAITAAVKAAEERAKISNNKELPVLAEAKLKEYHTELFRLMKEKAFDKEGSDEDENLAKRLQKQELQSFQP